MRISISTLARVLVATGTLTGLVSGVSTANASIGVIGTITESTPGTPLKEVASRGIGVNQETSDLYVAEESRNRIVELDPSGHFILTFGREVDATKVKEGEEGKTVSETETNTCTAASGDQCQAGSEGSEPGQLQEPNQVIVAPASGDVYVTDAHGTQEFNPEGQYLTKVNVAAAPGPEATYLEAVDTEGNLYAGGGNSKVEERTLYLNKYTPAGEYTGVKFVVGNKNIGDNVPDSLEVNADGELYVTGSENVIWRFASSNTPLGTLEPNMNEHTYGNLTIDLSNGDVFAFAVQFGVGVTERYPLMEYTSTGQLVGSYTGLFPNTGVDPTGLAFAPRTGRLYVLRGNSEILVYGPFPVPAAGAPLVSDEGVKGDGVTSATLDAKVDPELDETTYSFQYATNASFAGATSVPAAPVAIGSGFLPVRVSVELSGLAPSTTYYYRVVAHNAFAGGSTVDGATETLTTVAPAPQVSTEGASEVTYNAATIDGVVVPGSSGAASDTRWCFEYGTGAGGEYDLGSLPLTPGDAGQGTSGVPVSLRLTSLLPGNTYRYRLVAVNSLRLGLGSTACGTEGGHESVGAQQTFTTPITYPAPVALSGGASGVSQNAAVISGSVNPNGVHTAYEFQLGLDTSYGAEVFGEAGYGSEAQAYSLGLSGLQPDTTYHYRIVAISDGGTSYGADESFTTSGYPTSVLVSPPTAPLLATPVFALPKIDSGGSGSKRAKTKKKAGKNSKTRKKRKKTRGKASVRGVGAKDTGQRRRDGSVDGRSGR